MENPLPVGPAALHATPPSAFREMLADALRYWEWRRVIYNFVLVAVVVAWIVGTWPHFRPMFQLQSVLLLIILGLIANACYCAAYLVDIPMQWSALAALWKRRRWTLWLAGMLLAILLVNYWIADEIYPYLR